jgi:hypothetical protein
MADNVEAYLYLYINIKAALIIRIYVVSSEFLTVGIIAHYRFRCLIKFTLPTRRTISPVHQIGTAVGVCEKLKQLCNGRIVSPGY